MIVTRTEWGARYADGAGPAPLPATEVYLHHSVTIAPDLVPPYDDEDAAMRVLEEIGQRKFRQGISYTYAVMPSGRIYEGHGVDRLGAHTAKRNGIARAIVLVGNYDVDQPTPAQIESTAALLVRGELEGWWTAARLTGGHQDAPGAATACPGRHGLAVVDDINTRAAAIAAAAHDQEDTMNAAQEQLLRDTLAEVRAIRHQSLGQNVAGDLQLIVQLLREGQPVDVDEEALAHELAPLLQTQLHRLPAADLQEIATGIFAELARRVTSPAALTLVAEAAAVTPELDDPPHEVLSAN